MEVAGPLGTPLGLALLRCAGKAGNPFQTTQGNRLSCRDQEGSPKNDNNVGISEGVMTLREAEEGPPQAG